MPFRVLAVGFAVLLFGCGASAPPGPTIYPVKGKLTKGGQPLKGVTVGLYPAGGASAKGTPGSGLTDDSGAFEIRSSGGLGVSEGSYKLVLSAPPPMIDYANQKGPPKPTVDLPKNLTSDKTSDRIVEVKASGENVVDVAL